MMRRETREYVGQHGKYHEFGFLSAPLGEAQEFGDPVRCLGYRYQGGAYYGFENGCVRVRIDFRLERDDDLARVRGMPGLFAPLFAYRAEAVSEFILTIPIHGARRVASAQIKFEFKAPYSGIENLREEFDLALKIVERRLERHIREAEPEAAEAMVGSSAPATTG